MEKIILSKELINKIKTEIIAELEARQIKLDSDSLEFIMCETKKLIQAQKPHFDNQEIISEILKAANISSNQKDLAYHKSLIWHKEVRIDFINEVLDGIEIPKDGKDGLPGISGKDGKDYALNDKDRLDIAESVDLKGVVTDSLFNRRIAQLIKDIQSGKIKIHRGGMGNVKASDVSNIPFGDITSLNMQGAINEISAYHGALEFTGITMGGLVSSNTDQTKIDINECIYFIQGTKYTYTAETGLTPTIGAGDSSTFAGLNSAGLIYSGSKWTNIQKQTIIPLARLQSVQGQSGPGSTLISPIDERFIISETGYLQRLWQEEGIGALYASGGTFTESSTPLQLNQLAGIFYTAQRNRTNINASSNITTKEFYHVGGVPTIHTDATLITPKYYDNGTGIVALSNQKYAAHTLLRSPKEDDSFFLIYSREEYVSLAEAEMASIDYGVFKNQASSGLISVAIIIVRGGSTNIESIVDFRPRIGGIGVPTTAGGIVTTYLGLSDTPLSYASESGKFPIINNAETGFDFLSGWNDLTSSLTTGKTTGGAAPTWASWGGTTLYTWQFSASSIDSLQIDPFHFKHDYKMGTNIYPHVHWMPDDTNTGVVRWGIEFTFAIGHSQMAFSTSTTTIYIEQAGSGTQYMHQVAEVSDPGITLSGLEPDTLISARIFRDATHANDTYTGVVHGLTVDIHYEADRAFTFSRSPDFYTP